MCNIYNIDNNSLLKLLGIPCFGGQFGINYPSAFLKMFKNQERDLSWDMGLLVNHTKAAHKMY